MTLLTERSLAAGYEFIRATIPRWGLPPASKVKFKIIKAPDTVADFSVNDFTPLISVSSANNGHTVTALASIAHEMVHLWQYEHKQPVNHGHLFKTKAARICRLHGFDPKTF